MSVALVLVIVAAGFSAVLLGVMLGFDALTYRKGSGSLLVTGFVTLILSGVRFYLAAKASVTHAAVSSLWYGEPIMPGQEYAIAVLLLLFGGTCLAFSLRRVERERNTPNV